MNEIPERKLELIRKLLAVAEHPATGEAEAAVFLEKACALMAAYGIEQAVLADTGQVRDEVDRLVIEIGNPYQPDRRALLGGVATALRCRTIYRKIGSVSEVQVVGYRSDLDLVEMLFTSLCLQMASGVLRVSVPPGHTTISYRKSWMAGYVNRVCERLRAAEAAAARDAARDTPPRAGRSTELVLRDRAAQVGRVYEQMFPNVRRAGRRALSDWSGWDGGRAAGDRADLGGSRLGAPARAPIGR
ncbi:DUF2786 domain-containing protein [Microtetraspora sp. AC03309]|uniref:DUF2786 domain-containing protein n=1 Tax=Microtetraspora sp. AC03309 TaxID=2779376 RepID=UPI001E3B0184|nr:DUF2786 domain-containing protein [Microtetraspora sp. AC03309]MCC5581328.1 DUF2786 domain-containing protein [Microtetraspora sp. AC03309]